MASKRQSSHRSSNAKHAGNYPKLEGPGDRSGNPAPASLNKLSVALSGQMDMHMALQSKNYKLTIVEACSVRHGKQDVVATSYRKVELLCEGNKQKVAQGKELKQHGQPPRSSSRQAVPKTQPAGKGKNLIPSSCAHKDCAKAAAGNSTRDQGKSRSSGRRH